MGRLDSEDTGNEAYHESEDCISQKDFHRFTLDCSSRFCMMT